MNRGDSGLGFPVGSYQATPSGAGTGVNALGNASTLQQQSGSQSAVYTAFVAGETIPAGSLVVQGNQDSKIYYAHDPNVAAAKFRPLQSSALAYSLYNGSTYTIASSSSLYRTSVPQKLTSGNYVASVGEYTSSNWAVNIIDPLGNIVKTVAVTGTVNLGGWGMAALAGGGFVIAYSQFTGGSYPVLFEIFDNNGNLLYGPTQFTTYSNGNEGGIGVAALPGGGFAICANMYNGSTWNPYYGTYSATGAPVVAAESLATGPAGSGEIWGATMKAMPNGDVGLAIDVFGTNPEFFCINAAGAVIVQTPLSTAGISGDNTTQLVVTGNSSCVLMANSGSTRYVYAFNGATIASSSYSANTYFASFPFLLPSGNIAFFESNTSASTLIMRIADPNTGLSLGSATLVSTGYTYASGPNVAMIPTGTGDNVQFSINGTVYETDITYSGSTPSFANKVMATSNGSPNNNGDCTQFAFAVSCPDGYTQNLVLLITNTASITYYQTYYNNMQHFLFVGVCIDNVVAGGEANVQIQGSTFLDIQVAFPFTAQYGFLVMNLIGDICVMETQYQSALNAGIIGTINGNQTITFTALFSCKVHVTYFVTSAYIVVNGVDVTGSSATSGEFDVFVGTGQTITITGVNSSSTAQAVVSYSQQL